MALGDFSLQAGAYKEARPGYPPKLLDVLVQHVGVNPGDPVADVGAGTGIFTQLLTKRGFRVTAIEPNEAMRREAPEVPGVTWASGTFEQTSLSDASQRWVVAAQAFHWADPPRALPEMRRILMTGGCFTVLWNNRLNYESSILSATQAIIRRHVPEFDELYRDRLWDRVLASTGDFGSIIYHEQRHHVPMTGARFLMLWKSHNRLATLAGTERLVAILVEIGELLEREEIEEVAVPYACKAWTGRRR